MKRFASSMLMSAAKEWYIMRFSKATIGYSRFFVAKHRVAPLEYILSFNKPMSYLLENRSAGKKMTSLCRNTAYSSGRNEMNDRFAATTCCVGFLCVTPWASIGEYVKLLEILSARWMTCSTDQR